MALCGTSLRRTGEVEEIVMYLHPRALATFALIGTALTVSSACAQSRTLGQGGRRARFPGGWLQQYPCPKPFYPIRIDQGRLTHAEACAAVVAVLSEWRDRLARGERVFADSATVDRIRAVSVSYMTTVQYPDPRTGKIPPRDDRIGVQYALRGFTYSVGAIVHLGSDKIDFAIAEPF